MRPANETDLSCCMAATLDDRRVETAVRRAEACSPFLKLQLETRPRLAEVLRAGTLSEALEMAKAAGADAPDVGAALRRERGGLALVLGVGDLAGALPLEQVVAELSDFADRALEGALAAAIEARTPGVEPKGFAVIALGKLGSRELNYSSDVDLLFLFDPTALPLKPREEPAQAAVRIGHRIVETLQKRDGEGYVFRVDLRLRPSPDAPEARGRLHTGWRRKGRGPRGCCRRVAPPSGWGLPRRF